MNFLKNIFSKIIKYKMDNLYLKSTKSYNYEQNINYNPKMKRLVDQLKADSYLLKKESYYAMLQVDRGDFIDSSIAYQDRYYLY